MLKLNVNGILQDVDVPEDVPLLWVLREELGLLGTKFGCGQALCGACTVHVNGEPVRSCQTYVDDLEDAEITTIEGIANGELHPMQQAFKDNHGLQCGFCTPGMVMSAAALLKENPKPTEAEIRHYLEGNLCRCTGYHNIVKAIMAASGQEVAPIAAE